MYYRAAATAACGFSICAMLLFTAFFAADMNLRAGDSVTIDKILGAYWLGGRSSGTVKVKQRQ